MKVSTVKSGTSTLNSEDLAKKGHIVYESLDGNKHYPTLQPLMPGLLKACETLDTANTEVVFNRGKVAFEGKYLADKALRLMLKQFGGYVQALSGGEKEKILTAGFDVAKTRSIRPKPEAPQKLTVRRSTVAGLLKVRWSGVHGGVLYYLEMLTEGSTEWVLIVNTTRTFEQVTDLVTGKDYSFRVQVVTTGGTSPMSEIVTAIAA